MNHFAFRVPEDTPFAWVVARYANVGDWVQRGQALFDMMTCDGVIRTIVADVTGMIRQIEGRRARRLKFGDMDAANDPRADGASELIRYNVSLGTVYLRGKLLCQVESKEGMDTGTAKELRPMFSRSLLNRMINAARPRVA